MTGDVGGAGGSEGDSGGGSADSGFSSSSFDTGASGSDRASLDAALAEAVDSPTTTSSKAAASSDTDRASLDAAFRDPEALAAVRGAVADTEPRTTEQQSEVAQAQIEVFRVQGDNGADAPASVGDAGTDQPDTAGADDPVVGVAQDRLHDLEQAGYQLGGDPIERAELWHEQGQGDPDYQGTCGIVAVEGVARDAGVNTDEGSLVQLARDKGLCLTDSDDRYANGGTSPESRAELLDQVGLDNVVRPVESQQDLADLIEQGDGVIARVSAGHLWNVSDPVAYSYTFDENRLPTGYNANHAVHVTGTVRNESGNLAGFVINDSGHDRGAGVVVDSATWNAAWDSTNGPHVINDVPPRDAGGHR